MNKIILLVIALIVVVGAVIYFTGSKPEEPVEILEETAHDGSSTAPPAAEPEDATTITPPVSLPQPPASPPPAASQVKTFNLTGRNFAFSQTEIKVKKGDTVNVNFESTDGSHDWTLDGYGVSTTQVNTGGKTSVQFAADKIGTFEYYCSVGSHRALGMIGKLIVE